MRAEGGLPEERRHELVGVDLVHLALHGSPPLPRHESPFLKLQGRNKQFSANSRHKKDDPGLSSLGVKNLHGLTHSPVP